MSRLVEAASLELGMNGQQPQNPIHFDSLRLCPILPEFSVRIFSVLMVLSLVFIAS